MPIEQIHLTEEDFPCAEFPEFYDLHIKDVLLELNAVLLESSIETKKSNFHNSSEHECNTSAEGHSINVLKSDMLSNPYLYLSDSLIQKIRSI